MEFEIHLMVQNPENVVGDWIHTGVSAIVAHIEATNDFQRVIDICRESAVKVGIAIKPSTNIDLIAPFVDKARPVRDSEGPQDAPISNGVDFIQVMGSDDLGKHGVELEDKAVEMIRALRERYPERIIAIDIGVSEETVKILVDAGVTKLISGGAILNSAHPEEVFHNLES
jgi:ribulose-phosphate 3-epimerase